MAIKTEIFFISNNVSKIPKKSFNIPVVTLSGISINKYTFFSVNELLIFERVVVSFFSSEFVIMAGFDSFNPKISDNFNKLVRGLFV